jgi:hypothetical protein
MSGTIVLRFFGLLRQLLPVFFISLRLERVDNLGAYRTPQETGILIPSDFNKRLNRCPRHPIGNRTACIRLLSHELEETG